MDVGLSQLQAMGAKRVGILGGTLNPIHNGHILMGQAALKEFALDAILLLPSGQPPHKACNELAPKEMRFEMAHLVAKHENRFVASRLEIEREDCIYTVDTLSMMKRAMPQVEWFYLIGSDTLKDLQTWKEYKRALSLCTYINFTRAERSQQYDQQVIRSCYPHDQRAFLMAQTRPAPISATEIRARIAQGLSLEGFVPSYIAQYMQQHDIYGQENRSIEGACQRLKWDLSPARYIHSLGVMETAIQFARIHGVEERQAAWAGLLHDCAKDIPLETAKSMYKQGKITLDDDVMAYAPQLIHAPLGAYWAREYYDMLDREILHAIAVHTTGSASMNELDKIIFLADIVEPNRKGDFVQPLYDLAVQDLDRAMRCALDESLAFLLKKDAYIHPDTIQARNAFWKKQKEKRI